MRCCQFPDCRKGEAWDALRAHAQVCAACLRHPLAPPEGPCPAWRALWDAWQCLTCRYLRHPDPPRDDPETETERARRADFLDWARNGPAAPPPEGDT